MPFYDYECEKCGREYEGYSRVENRRQSRCPDCGGHGQILIKKSTPVIFVPYYSHALGCYIKSKGEKLSKMRELGVEETTGMKAEEIQREADRWRAHREKVRENRPVPQDFLDKLQEIEAKTPTQSMPEE